MNADWWSFLRVSIITIFVCVGNGISLYAEPVAIEVMRRVYLIRSDEGLGTAFSVEVDGRQYLVTAAHVVRSIPVAGEARLGLFRGDEWTNIVVTVVGRLSGYDLSVFAPAEGLAPQHPKVGFGIGDLAAGQDVYFFGFPVPPPKSKLGAPSFPIPWIRKATVSFIDDHDLILDGNNIGGFSGGPVVVPESGGRFRIVGFVQSRTDKLEPVIGTNGEPTPLSARTHTGIIHAGIIDDAIRLIRISRTASPVR